VASDQIQLKYHSLCQLYGEMVLNWAIKNFILVFLNLKPKLHLTNNITIQSEQYCTILILVDKNNAFINTAKQILSYCD